MKETKYLQKFVLKNEVDRSHLMEQYKLLVATLNQMNAMRATSNIFYASGNSIIFAALSYTKDVHINPMHHNFLFVLITSVGIMLCLSWISLLNSHKKILETYTFLVEDVETAFPAPVFSTAFQVLSGTHEEKSTLGELATIQDDKSTKGLAIKEIFVPCFFISAYVIYGTAVFFM